MQISTKVSTQVILTQDELKTAAIEFVKANMELPTDATFVVEFEDDVRGDLTAVIDITGTTGAGPATKPKVTKAERQAKLTPLKPVEPVVEAQNPAPEPEAVANITANPEDRVEPAVEEPPFDVTDKDANVSTEELPVVADAPKVDHASEAAARIGKIFPDTTTSAPAMAKVELEVDPAAKAKSLFANLVKPTN